MTQEKINILGSEISVLNLEETVEKLLALSQGGEKHYICISNVHTVVMGYHDSNYLKVTNSATLATADGVPLIWASKILKEPQIHGRANGPDIMKKILTEKKCAHLSHYFYGSTEPVLKSLKENLLKLNPDAKLSGFYSPPIQSFQSIETLANPEELKECKHINEASPDIVWVGLGAPKQEIWMYRMRKHLNAPLLIGVGAAFDFLAGFKKRAPLWVQKNGLEWLHRFSQEPRRLAGRYLKTNPIFVMGVLKQAWNERTKWI